MRRLVATSLLIVCAVLTSGCGLLDEAPTRTELGSLETFKGKGFRIKLPCIPSESREAVPFAGRKPLSTRIWLCDGGDIGYVVSTTAFPNDMQVNLDSAAQGGADAVDGEVVANKKITFAGVPGRDARIEASFDGDPATLFVRILVHERTLYQVQVILNEEGAKKPPKRYQQILKSLSFK